MSIDSTTPRTRRAILLGAFGGVLATAAGFAKAPAVRAGVDGDLIVDDTSTGLATTELNAASSNPAMRVIGGASGMRVVGDMAVDALGGTIAVNAIAVTAPAIGVVGWSQADSAGILGWSTNGTQSTPTVPAKTGVHGVAEQDAAARGVFGRTTAGQGVRGEATTGTGVRGEATTGIGVVAASSNGLALSAQSTLGHAVRGRGQLDGVIGESPGGRSGLVGYSGGGSAPAGPAKTGVYGEATQDSNSRGVSGFALAGQGVRGEATTGQGVAGIATSGQAVRGDAATGIGVIGFSGAASTPLTKIGVYGEASQDANARGVFGKTTVGQGVRGEATSGIGVRAVSATGSALDVSGKVKFSRSGIASVPANQDLVDVPVPGGISSSSMVLAVMQMKRAGVWVIGARPNWPTPGLLRIYLNKVGSTTAATPVAWFVLQ